MTEYKYVPVPLEDIRKYRNYAVLLESNEGVFQGDLLTIDDQGIYIEIGEGRIVEVDVRVLRDEHTRLFRVTI